MPRPGGEADKLGNRYEGIFLAWCAVDLLTGTVGLIEVEPIEPDEAAGVELYRVHPDGHREYWSVKRQRSKSPFTFAALKESQPTLPNGILGAAAEKLLRSDAATFRFFSQTIANELFELPRLAREVDGGEAMLRAAASRTIGAAYRRVREATADDDESAITVLRRFEAKALSEEEAGLLVELRLRQHLVRSDGAPLDVAALRLQLTDLVIGRLGIPIHRAEVETFLREHGIHAAAWSGADLVNVLDRWNAPALARVNRTLINGRMISRAEVETLIANIEKDPVTLVSAGAGYGKSSVLADFVERLRERGIPTAIIRLDSIEPMTSRQLGLSMGLAESPALVLGNDGPGILILDQLDAVSVTSGRNPRLRPLLHELLAEASQVPSLRVVLACRSFDLEFDDELRTIAQSPETRRIDVGLLDIENVGAALAVAGVTSDQLRPEHVEILRVPRNLYMFTKIAATRRATVISEIGLFDTYWDTVERNVRERSQSNDFAPALACIAAEMGRREALWVPSAILDRYGALRDSLASEAVITVHEQRIAFFHESFLDYVVARALAGNDQSLTEWVLGLPEQSLFRRSQVRQVLEYRRATDENLYLRDLEQLLSSEGVRFHIKHLVIQWLSQQPARPQEWRVIERCVAAADPQTEPHLISVVRNNVAWFDLLHELGVWRAWLGGGEKERDRAITLLAMPEVTTSRHDEVAKLLLPLTDDPEWHGRLTWHVCRVSILRGELQRLFLRMLQDGQLDDARPGIAMNDDFWSLLYADATAEPAFTAEAIAVWMARRVGIAQVPTATPDEASDRPWPDDHSQAVGHVVLESADRAPEAFVRFVLPAMAAAIEAFGESVFVRISGGGHDIPSLVVEGLERSLQSLARNSPETLVALLAPEPPRSSHEAFLRLAAYSANPSRFWPDIVRLFEQEPRFLRLEHQIGGFGERNPVAGAAFALQSIGELVDTQSFALLEKLVLNFRPASELPGHGYGRTAWRLLQRLPEERLSAIGRRRLQELTRKFGERSDGGHSIAMMEFGPVPSPVPPDAVTRMSDENLVEAMLKYSEDRIGSNAKGTTIGGLHEFGVDVEELAREQPQRLARLAIELPDSIHPSYFGRILRGVTQAMTDGNLNSDDEVWRLLRRMDGLPGRPCGEEIAGTIARLASRGVPEDIVLTLSWYAACDPDPTPANDWLNEVDNIDKDDHQLWQLQSVRGHATWALHSVLAYSPERSSLVAEALDTLCDDPVISVRACLAQALIPTFVVAPDEAIGRFKRLSTGTPNWFLGLPPVREFIHYAVYYDYVGVRDLLVTALDGASSGAVKTAASQIALAALGNDEARKDAALVQRGSEGARAAAAEVYAANCFGAGYSAECRLLLREAFHDDSALVQKEAAEFAWRAPIDELVADPELLADFVNSPAFGNGRLSTLFVRLEQATSLPVGLMPAIGKKALDLIGPAGGNITTSEASDAHTLAPLIFRAYADAPPEVRSELLDVIDGAMQLGWMGVDKALETFERS